MSRKCYKRGLAPLHGDFM